MDKNYWTDNSAVDRYTAKFHNRYAAVRYIGELARKLCEKYDDHILHSEALSWILTGKVPDAILHPRPSYERIRQTAIIDYYLETVIDEDVVSSVRNTLDFSLSEGHLIYLYNEGITVFQQSRVRVLSNIIWDKLHSDS